MSERVVKVSIQAQVSNFLSGMEQARKKSKELGETTEQLKARLQEQQQAMSEVGAGMLKVGAIATIGIALAVKQFSEFDEAISNVKAATRESTENMGLLREAALDAGASTVFSATEAANAIEELGKAGLSTQQILNGGLDGALSLAAAGQLGVAEAAQIAAIAVKQFNLEGSDVPHVADLLAAGAGKAVGDVEDLAAALGQAGLVANGAGQSIEDTTGVLAAFADAGLLGSDAGTSLKSALIALQAPTAKAKGLMDEYGLSFYDGSGKMLDYSEIAGQLESKLGHLDDETRNAALAQIFGNDALRSANVLYGQGEKGIQKYIDQTNDSGYAAKVAADRLNNLKGDLEALGGAFDTYMIKSGSGANDSLRALAQGATGLVTAVGDLPGPALTAGLAIGGIVAAVGLAGGAALVAVPKIAQFKVALATLNVSGGTAAKGIGAVSGAVAGAGLAFSLWAAKQAKATSLAAEFAATMDKTTGAVTAYTRETVAKKLAEEGAFDAAKDVGISQKELTDAIFAGGDALEEVRGKIGGNTAAWKAFTPEFIRAGSALSDISDITEGLGSGTENLKDQAAAAGESAESTTNAAESYGDAADKAGELQSNLSALIDTINEANGVGQDAVSQNIAYQDALAGVDEHIENARKGVEGYALGLNQSTQVGRDNMGMLNDLAGNYQSAAEAQFALDGNTTNYTANLAAGRQAVLDRAAALGATDEQIQFLSEHIVNMPSEKEIQIIADTQDAIWSVDRFIEETNKRYAHVRIAGKGGSQGGMTEANGAVVDFYRNGGLRDNPMADFFANGGMRENHVAQIAPAGAWRVWAEPETGGEAYIPLAMSKRARSLAIWEETGARLGARGYADGGVIQYAAPNYISGGPTTVIPQVSLAGATFAATIDGRPITMMIQEQIVSYDNKGSMTQRMGKQVR